VEQCVLVQNGVVPRGTFEKEIEKTQKFKFNDWKGLAHRIGSLYSLRVGRLLRKVSWVGTLLALITQPPQPHTNSILGA
jgi:hypothetical protein